jgi:molybdopterin synthase catalytic subunit
MLEDIFKAKEEVLKLDKKSMRIWKVETINVDKPIITETTMKEPAFK